MAEAGVSKSDGGSSFFYHENLDSVPDAISDILQTYSGVPREQQIPHITTVRNQAYKVHPYPCLGRFRFLQLELTAHPLYQSYLLPRLLNAGNETEKKLVFLDLGCCLAQDVRKLIFDGVDVKYLYGGDLVQDFIDAGYDLFRDEQKLPRDHFICPADIFDNSEGNKLSVLDGQVDLLHVTAVFHLFGQEKQEDVAVRCLRLVNKRQGAKCLILGAQVGNINASDLERSNGSRRYRHNEDSWRAMWESVCEKSEFKGSVKTLKVEVHMRQAGRSENPKAFEKMMGGVEEGFRWMVFSVWLEF